MLPCVSHHEVMIYDRGGEQFITRLPNPTLVRWGRVRDAISEAQVRIPTSDPDCDRAVGLVATGRHELVVYRDGARVWEGPITLTTFHPDYVEIDAKDVVHYFTRMALSNEYDSSYPNVETVNARTARILSAELARFEGTTPGINILDHLVFHNDGDIPSTTSHTLRWEMTVFDEIDTKAYRGGLDYVALGRSIHFFDTYHPLGHGPTIGPDDFLGPIIVSEYGSELATHAYVTDGLGNAGSATVPGGDTGFYGRLEYLDYAYDESAEESANPEDPPTLAELSSQAERNLSGRHPIPTVVRVPDNTVINPSGAMSFDTLVPGTWFPLHARVPGRTVSQVQKLDSMSVEETREGEAIKVVFSPAPGQVAAP